MSQPSPAQCIAANVRVEVARRGLRHAAISAALDLKQPAVSRRMTGQVEFSATELQKLAALLEVSVADLYGEQVTA